MNRLSLILALLPLPALADLPPPVAVAVNQCLADGQSLAARAEALATAGWRDVGPAESAAAALAIAPVRLLLTGRTDLSDPLADRLDDLGRQASRYQDLIAMDLPTDHWLVAPDVPAYLNITENRPGLVFCTLAADISAADYAALLDRPTEPVTSIGLPMTRIVTSEDNASSPFHVVFDAAMFGGHVALPILFFPASVAPE